MSLRGDRCLADALSDGIQRGMRRARLTYLLGIGISTGLIDDAGAIPETLREASIQVRDRLSGDLAAVRHIHGGTARARDVIDHRQRSEVSIRGDGPLADAVCLSLTSSGVGNVLRADSAHSSSRVRPRSAPARCSVMHHILMPHLMLRPWPWTCRTSALRLWDRRPLSVPWSCPVAHPACGVGTCIEQMRIPRGPGWLPSGRIVVHAIRLSQPASRRSRVPGPPCRCSRSSTRESTMWMHPHCRAP